MPQSAFQNTAYLVYVFDGDVDLLSKGLRLAKGDSLIIWEEDKLILNAASSAVLVAFVINRDATYTRSGMYSGLKR